MNETTQSKGLPHLPVPRANHAAYYASTISDFLAADDASVYARLTGNRGFPLSPEQLSAWETQTALLRPALSDLSGWIHLEFNIPRIGKRADAVLIIGSAIIVVEFKVGATAFAREDLEQAWDYALDLRNFHDQSHFAQLFPILCATDATPSDRRWRAAHADAVHPPRKCDGPSLGSAIREAVGIAQGRAIDGDSWGRGRYSPTPTIIEAARALYGRHTVHDIIRHDAHATNLAITSRHVEAVIKGAQEHRRKSIVFVTGVPGAGKTLVGLNVAARHGDEGSGVHATFLSGNGPLVSVLREALARDEHARRLRSDPAARIGDARRIVQSFIQPIHHFRDDTLRDASAPDDHVVVFDEAQRAWHAKMLGSFMKRKRNVPGFSQSEPEVLIGAMDRHEWAAIICLVGGGQEINRGEAGISAWLDAIRLRFPHWEVHLSNGLNQREFAAETAIRAICESSSGLPKVLADQALHLAVSMRSFRAESVSHFVNALLAGELGEGRELIGQFRTGYPIVVTRSMRDARAWVVARRRGSERAGLVASSSAQRLKPHAVDIRVNINPVHWFLGSADDTRSSQFLEDAATEFQVQGLELDWTIVAWDADLRRSNGEWTFHDFRGSRWTDVHTPDKRRYLLNAYRVLLTRARQGMAIFVPPGRKRDSTRSPAYYDEVYDFLVESGIDPI